MEKYPKSVSIKYWAEDDRPRDKLLLKGKHAVSDSELLAIILGTGTSGTTALDLGKQLLEKADNSLQELSRFSVQDLTNGIRGIGKAKALTLLAAMELANRRNYSNAIQKVKVSCSLDAFKYVHPYMADAVWEEFWLLLLSRSNRVIRAVKTSEGGIHGTVADPKRIFQTALEQKASAIIMSHNHPSGNTKPSATDIQLTRNLKKAGNILEINVIDHLILGGDSYFSFADNGLL